MSLIRVHFGPMPTMLRSIIGDLLHDEPDIVAVGTSASHEECMREARQEGAAIIITQDVSKNGTTCLDLILADPPFGVLAVSEDGHSAAGLRLIRTPITLESGNSSVLSDAIRRLVAELSVGSAAIRPTPATRQRPNKAGSEAVHRGGST